MSGTVHRTIRLLQRAVDLLGARLPLHEVERIGFIVNRAMTVQGRMFHTPEHIFDLADPRNPYMTLAALFHDIVYFHVDEGFVPEIQEIVSPYVVVKQGTVSLRTGIAKDDMPYWGSLAIFGFRPGTTPSPFGGLNEFLSALVMNRLLYERVDTRVLLITTACIEATIPFRTGGEGRPSPSEALKSRIEETNRRFDLGFSPEDMEEAVEWAVIFANRDVRNFAEEDVGRFLDNTWKLLPETNPSLRISGVYTVKSYRSALQRMEGFMSRLDPSSIFHHYKDTPAQEEYANLYGLARRNVEVGRDYLGVKLLSTGILEALTQVSGGDCPMAYVMGDIDEDEEGSRLEDHLPAQAAARKSGAPRVDPVLEGLFEFGRASESSFDLKNSPLSLFVYRSLGHAGFRKHLEAARPFISGEEDAERFLERLPKKLVRAVATACAEVAFTRKEALKPYLSA